MSNESYSPINLNESQTGESEAIAPPPTNRGVLNTGLEFGGLKLDWLQATFPDTPEVREFIRQQFQPKDIVEKGFNGYSHSAKVYDFGTLLWSKSRPDMGLHLILPAQALARIRGGAYYIMSVIVNNGGRVKRVDFAADDTIGLLNLELIAYKLGEGEVVSRFKKWRKWFTETEIGSKEQFFSGVTIGSRESESYIRIYDKALEQRKKGISDVPAHWIRVELETKGDRAEELAKRFVGLIEASDRANLIRSLLFGLIDFKNPEVEDTNKSRWKTCNWWANFLDEVSKMTLSLPKPVQSQASVRSWFKDVIAPMAAVIMLYNDDPEAMSGYDWLMSVIADGEKRWQARHYRLANITPPENLT